MGHSLFHLFAQLGLQMPDCALLAACSPMALQGRSIPTSGDKKGTQEAYRRHCPIQNCMCSRAVSSLLNPGGRDERTLVITTMANGSLRHTDTLVLGVIATQIVMMKHDTPLIPAGVKGNASTSCREKLVNSSTQTYTPFLLIIAIRVVAAYW